MAHDAHHLSSPRTLEHPRARSLAAVPPRTIDWLSVGVWAGVLVASCAVWGGIALAIAALAG